MPCNNGTEPLVCRGHRTEKKKEEPEYYGRGTESALYCNDSRTDTIIRTEVSTSTDPIHRNPETRSQPPPHTNSANFGKLSQDFDMSYHIVFCSYHIAVVILGEQYLSPKALEQILEKFRQTSSSMEQTLQTWTSLLPKVQQGDSPEQQELIKRSI